MKKHSEDICLHTLLKQPYIFLGLSFPIATLQSLKNVWFMEWWTYATLIRRPRQSA